MMSTLSIGEKQIDSMLIMCCSFDIYENPPLVLTLDILFI